MTCPVCRGVSFRKEVAVAAVRDEIRVRNAFVHSRLKRKASRAELKDLTDFMHGFATPLLSCLGCGLLIRGEQNLREAGAYEEDPNDPDLMHQVLPRYVRAFRNKQPAHKSLVRPHADVLEIGSHLGAFLQVAEEWNWNAVALDVGRDTSEFAIRNGFRVYQETVEDCHFRNRQFEAVLVWNCFEQIPNPEGTLRGIHRVLKRHGVLVVRVPNALFYRIATDCDALAYNNLLGFPYLYGYDETTLDRLAARCGFLPIRGFNSELVTMPFADPTAQIASEQLAVSARVNAWSRETMEQFGQLTGPWIEVVYRKVDELPQKVRHPRIDSRFLKRAA